MSVEVQLVEALARLARDREIAGVVARVETVDNEFTWSGSEGELFVDSPFFIASTTKLYTATLIFRLIELGSLEFGTRLIDVLGADQVSGLHVIDGDDRTDQITIKHLLAQTSGLADYFEGVDETGSSLEERIRSGDDSSWGLEFVLDTARGIGASFPPGAKGKALYSDTNYQLLGSVVEELTGMTFEQALNEQIISRLGLESTWLYSDPTDDRPAPLRDGEAQVHVPLAMTSFGPDGGIVSTASEMMMFLRGFFEGEFFSKGLIPDLMVWNRIFYPLRYGVGIARFRLPRAFTPFSAPDDLIGHSGLSGAFAFLEPNKGVYLTGTVNNLNRPDRAFRLMVRMLRAF